MMKCMVILCVLILMACDNGMGWSVVMEMGMGMNGMGCDGDVGGWVFDCV